MADFTTIPRSTTFFRWRPSPPAATPPPDRAACLAALQKNQADARQVINDVLAKQVALERYTREVEVERDQQRQAYFDTRQKLLAFHEDLLRNVAYIKTLHTETDILKQASLDRETYVKSLNEQLARQENGGTGPDLSAAGAADRSW